MAHGDDGDARRYRFREVMKAHCTEYQANDLEIGMVYPAGALVPDGTPKAPVDPTGRHYVASTRPGVRLPHAWIERGSQRISTQDLVPRDGFVLITGAAGGRWREAVPALAQRLGIRIESACIADEGELADRGHGWRNIREVADDGAILVRPDQIVAWRSAQGVANPAAELAAVMRAVLRINP